MRLLVSSAVLILAFSPHNTCAHHDFGAEFDPNRPLILRGPIVKVEWVNPPKDIYGLIRYRGT